MTFRRRLIAVCAAAVALGVVGASVACLLVVRGLLRGQVDDALRAQAQALSVAPPPAADARVMTTRRLPPQRPTDPPALFAVLIRPGDRGLAGPAGSVRPPPVRVPARARDLRAGAGPLLFDDTLDGAHVRFLAQRRADGAMLLAARPLDDVDDALGRLALALAGVSLAGLLLAAVGARAAARTTIAPVMRLTETAEAVAATRDLTQRIGTQGDRELARLADAFNRMLEALERSDRAQKQLVADASHELRTPLTSLRLNLELLTRRQLPAADADGLRRDLVAQIEDLTRLVGDLVEVARDDEPAPRPAEALDLAELVADAVRRARAAHPGVRFDARLQAAPMRGRPERLERAVGNLLDNAAHWSPPDGTVEVRLADGELTVRDHGPGIPAEDRPHVFERFYRARTARSRPGSGLGLAIVEAVVRAHDGSVRAEEPPGGGALLRVRLPVSHPIQQ